MTFTYDMLGRPTNFTDPDSAFTYTYDDGDRNPLTSTQVTGLSVPVYFLPMGLKPPPSGGTFRFYNLVI
jgi:hypothetical protein